MPNFDVINGLAYIVESGDNQEHLDDYTQYTFDSARSYLIGTENLIKESLLKYASDITKTYSEIKSPEQRNVPPGFLGKIYSISEMMNSYDDYHSGMVDYMRLIGSLKIGDVSIDSVKEKLGKAIDNDCKLIKGINLSIAFPVDRNGRVECIRQIEEAPRIVNTIHAYLDELTEIENQFKSLNGPELEEISQTAMNLMCGSITKVMHNIKSYFVANVGLLRLLLNPNMNTPTMTSENAQPSNAFRML